MGYMVGVRSLSVLPLYALALALLSAGCSSGTQAGTPALLPGGQASAPGTDWVGRAAVPANLTQQLAELDAMPCPAGAAPETWSQLRNAMRAALAGRADVSETRGSPDAPSGRESSLAHGGMTGDTGRTAYPSFPRAASALALAPPTCAKPAPTCA